MIHHFSPQEWAREEGNLHRCLASKILTAYGRTPHSRRLQFASSLNQFLFTVSPRSGFQILLVSTCSKCIQEEKWQHGKIEAVGSLDLQGHIRQTCSYKDRAAGLNQNPTKVATVQIYCSIFQDNLRFLTSRCCLGCLVKEESKDAGVEGRSKSIRQPKKQVPFRFCVCVCGVGENNVCF